MLVLDDQHEWNGSKVYWFTRLSQAWAHKVEHNQGYAFKKRRAGILRLPDGVSVPTLVGYFAIPWSSYIRLRISNAFVLAAWVFCS